MQVLRRGGEHLEAREYWRWVALAIVLGTMLLVTNFTLRRANLAHPFFPATVIVVLPALVLAGKALPRIVARVRAVRKGRLGEKLVTDVLAALPDDYYLVNDIVLGAGNIDHVVTGPCGIVVIETKRIAGHIGCEGDRWFVNGRRAKSYSRQAKAGAMAVKTFLAARHTALRTVYVQAVVVFTDPRCEVRASQPTVNVVRFSELLPLVTDIGRSRRMPPDVARDAAHSLASSARR